MQAFLQSIAVPVLVLECDRGGIIRFLGANGDACRLFALEPLGPEEAAAGGPPLRELLSADLTDDLTLAAAETLATGADVVIEHTAPDRWMRLTLRPFGQDGGGRQVLCTVTAARHGLTAHSASQAELASGIGRLRLRILERIIATGGHALGNYLQPILTFSRYAMENVPAATRNTCLGYVHEAGEQILSLLAVSRVIGRAGTMPNAVVEEVSVNHLIEDVVDVCPMLLPLDVAARSEIEAQGARVESCRSDLILVLLTLILDAADSLVRKGEIVLRACRGASADRLVRPFAPNGPCLRIDVESTGARRETKEGSAATPLGSDADLVLGLIARCGGGLGVFRPSPETARVSLYLPERAEGGG